MMNKLIITGNGFDLYHGLKTSYTDFRNYLDKHATLTLSSGKTFQLSTLAERYLDRKDKCGKFLLWKDFEYSLGQIDEPRLTTDLKNHQLDRHDLDELMGELGLQFSKWLNTILYKDAQKKDQFQFSKQDRFLSFNYTLTLEEVYKIQANFVTHIHGTVKEGENIIFGHGRDWDETKTPLDDYFRKSVPYVIHSYAPFFQELNTVNQIFVLGHSFGDVDLPYFSTIRNNVPKNTLWTISYEDAYERDLFMKKLTSIGILCLNLKHMDEISIKS